MARNLLKAGSLLIIHNRNRGVVDELSKEARQAAASSKEIAERSGPSSLCLLTADVRAGYAGNRAFSRE